MELIDNQLFQVSIKGLCFDEQNRLMMVKEKSGVWDLPGGRIKHGEEFVECLKRECQEELGLVPVILNPEPIYIGPSIIKNIYGWIIIGFKVKFETLDFTPSDECVEIKFFTKDEIVQLNTFPTVQRLIQFIK